MRHLNLRNIRETKGLTQAELATEVGVKQHTVSQWENGKRKPSVELAKRIAAVLGFDWTRFFEEK